MHDTFEHFINVGIILGWSLKVLHIFILSETFGFIPIYFPFHVTFIPHQYFRQIRVHIIFLDPGEPFLNISERVFSGQVKCYDQSVCGFKCGLRDGTEAFLAGGIPN